MTAEPDVRTSVATASRSERAYCDSYLNDNCSLTR